MIRKTFKSAMCMLLLAACMPCKSQNEWLFSPKGIARIDINLLDGKQIGDIQHDEKSVPAEKLLAMMTLSNANGSTYADNELYNGKIKIKGRGNTSWHQPKRPYSIDLIDDAGEDNPAGLLGMPDDEEWALIAFYTDPSYMRNPLAYYLGGMMDGIRWAPRTRYAEVYINNDYRGIYILCEKIRRGDNRVNVKKLDESKENGITGGYILECTPDDRVKDDEINTLFHTAQYGNHFIFKYPKPKNATQQQVEWINNYVSDMERRLEARDHSEETGWRKYADTDGFIDWMILHDLSKGVDNLFHASVFVEKDRNSKLRMSVPWDFDISFGNHTGNSQHHEDEMWIRKTQWFGKMYEDKTFADAVAKRYKELMPLFDNAPAIIAANYNQLEASGAIERDQNKYPDMINSRAAYENEVKPTTHKGYARWLAEWFESRKSWLYMNYGTSTEENCTSLKSYRPVMRVDNPDEFAAGRPSKVRTVRGYTAYLWDGKTRTTSHEITVNDNNEHYVQIIDEHGCTSLPSLAIRRGQPYADAFGTSKTTGINNITTNAGTHPLVITAARSGRTACVSYAAKTACDIKVNVTDASGSIRYTETIKAEAGLGTYSISLGHLPAGIYIIRCNAGNDTAVKKISM